MIVTPTATASAGAGFGFWNLVWITACKLDTVMHFCGYKDSNLRDPVFNWIRSNKGVTLILTEIMNLLMHWKALSSPNLMTFVLGGTVANVGWVFGIIPAFQRFFGNKPREVIG
jgi:hypothetical protein